MTIRNVLLLAAAVVFAIGFLTVGDGCQGYVSEDNVNWVCNDSSNGVAPLVAHVGRWLFAGLVVLSLALLDHGALRRSINNLVGKSSDEGD